jgi:hypothetical protein
VQDRVPSQILTLAAGDFRYREKSEHYSPLMTLSGSGDAKNGKECLS